MSAVLDAARDERFTGESLVEAWANVFESLEAHLQDRVAMRDEANPAVYLSILRSSVADVLRSSGQVRAARWAEYNRHTETIAALREELAATLQELIDHNGDGMDDARAKRVAELRL